MYHRVCARSTLSGPGQGVLVPAAIGGGIVPALRVAFHLTCWGRSGCDREGRRGWLGRGKIDRVRDAIVGIPVNPFQVVNICLRSVATLDVDFVWGLEIRPISTTARGQQRANQ